MQRLNIIKHIEEETGKDIWDFQEIVIILDGNKYNHNPLYCFKKTIFETTHYHSDFDAMIDAIDEDDRSYDIVCLEHIHNKEIKRKSQIFNRLQYIKQSGYKFKEYRLSNINGLCIVFE